VLGIRDKIEKKDWEGIAAIFEKVSMAQEDSEKQALGLDAKISKIENELLVPMKVLLSSANLSATHTRDDALICSALLGLLLTRTSPHSISQRHPLLRLPHNFIRPSGVVDVVCGEGDKPEAA
jgi:hypothetical protein